MATNDAHCIWVGIGLNVHPGEPAYKDLISLSQKLMRKEYFNETNSPHVNLYDFHIPVEQLATLENTLEGIASQYGLQKLQISRVNSFPFGAVFLDLKGDESLLQLEKDIVMKCHSLRGQCRTEEYWQPWRNYTAEQIENREKYGNPHVMTTFTPHLTLGYLKVSPEELESKCQEVASSLNLAALLFDHLDLVAKTSTGEILLKKSYTLKG